MRFSHCSLRRARRVALPLAALCAVASQSLGAQTPLPRDRLVVYVYDAADGAPLPQSTVTFVLEGEAQRRYTDDEGRFYLNVPLSGSVTFQVRRIGYAPATAVATLPVRRNRFEITLARTGTTLARVEVTAGPVFAGIVASSTAQQPIPNASVTLVGSTARMQTDSAGRFALPVDGRTDVTLSVRAEGFAPRLVLDRPPAGESREMLILLDAISEVGNRMYQNLDDREQRVRWRGRDAGAVAGRELREQRAPGLADALRSSPAVAARGLVFDDGACLFVNGDPRPGQTLASFPTDDVDIVEFYGVRGGEYVGTLMSRWPRNQPCGSGSVPSARPDRVTAVVIWTR